MKKILLDVRFWIIFFFSIRLIGITNAPLETGHNWRQSLTNMISRNFLENQAHILYPTMDMAGEKSGIIASEFPFFNYLIYILSSIFGYTHWFGRLINLVISSVGLFVFYELVRKLFNKQTAFNATIVLTTSIWFGFSRKIMPDTFSVSLVIIGLNFAYNYLKNGWVYNLMFFFLLSTLGMLCKIPAFSIFSLIVVVFFIKDIDFRRKITLFAASGLSVFAVGLWYFFWVPFLLESGHSKLYFPHGFIEGIREISPLIPELLEKFYFSSLHSYFALVCFLFGLGMMIRDKNKLILFSFAIVLAVFSIFIVKTGAIFPTHSYYIIPFTPIMAIMAGYAISKVPIKIQYVLLGLIAFEGIANQQHDFFIKKDQLYKLELEDITGKLIPPSDLIIINGGMSPQDIYFSHRKGWSIENSEITNSLLVDSLVTLGAKYLIVDKSGMKKLNIKYPTILTDDHYSIYKLK